MLKAEKIVGRNGMIFYRCRLCGHIFSDSKKYTRHLIKSHLRNTNINKRLAKKIRKKLEIIENKIKNGEKLNRYEQYIYLKIKLNKINL